MRVNGMAIAVQRNYGFTPQARSQCLPRKWNGWYGKRMTCVKSFALVPYLVYRVQISRFLFLLRSKRITATWCLIYRWPNFTHRQLLYFRNSTPWRPVSVTRCVIEFVQRSRELGEVPQPSRLAIPLLSLILNFRIRPSPFSAARWTRYIYYTIPFSTILAVFKQVYV